MWRLVTASLGLRHIESNDMAHLARIVEKSNDNKSYLVATLIAMQLKVLNKSAWKDIADDEDISIDEFKEYIATTLHGFQQYILSHEAKLQNGLYTDNEVDFIQSLMHTLVKMSSDDSLYKEFIFVDHNHIKPLILMSFLFDKTMICSYICSS